MAARGSNRPSRSSDGLEAVEAVGAQAVPAGLVRERRPRDDEDELIHRSAAPRAASRARPQPLGHGAASSGPPGRSSVGEPVVEDGAEVAEPRGDGRRVGGRDRRRPSPRRRGRGGSCRASRRRRGRPRLGQSARGRAGVPATASTRAAADDERQVADRRRRPRRAPRRPCAPAARRTPCASDATTRRCRRPGRRAPGTTTHGRSTNRSAVATPRSPVASRPAIGWPPTKRRPRARRPARRSRAFVLATSVTTASGRERRRATARRGRRAASGSPSPAPPGRRGRRPRSPPPAIGGDRVDDPVRERPRRAAPGRASTRRRASALVRRLDARRARAIDPPMRPKPRKAMCTVPGIAAGPGRSVDPAGVVAAGRRRRRGRRAVADAPPVGARRSPSPVGRARDRRAGSGGGSATRRSVVAALVVEEAPQRGQRRSSAKSDSSGDRRCRSGGRTTGTRVAASSSDRSDCGRPASAASTFSSGYS